MSRQDPRIPPSNSSDNWFVQNLPGLANTGLNIWQQYRQNRSQNRINQQLQQRTQQMDELAKAEQQRREFYAATVLPTLMRALGIKDPNMLNLAQQRRQALPGYGGPPQTQTQSFTPDPSGGGGSSGGAEFDPDRWRFDRFQPPELE